MTTTDFSWVVPEDGWDAADGGVSKQLRAARPTSQQTPALDASGWESDGDPFRSLPGSPTKGWPNTDTSTDAVFASPLLTHTHIPREKGTPDTHPLTQSSSKDTIPPSFAKVITTAFGYHADLYSDVLKVPRNASARDVRVAYFRRGREVLADDRVDGTQGSATVNGTISSRAKLRFQAVSMAYDILSNPEWRQDYETFGLHGGLLSDDDDLGLTDAPPSVASTPALRPSQTFRRSGVHWNEQVEELVFDQYPEETSFKGNMEQPVEDENKEKRSKRSKKKSRKKKKQIIVETDALQEHLEKLNAEAERSFISEFMEDIERSFGSMLSLGSYGTSTNEQKEYFVDARKKMFAGEKLEPTFDPMIEANYESENHVDPVFKKKRKTKKKKRPIQKQEDLGRIQETRAASPELDLAFDNKDAPRDLPMSVEVPKDLEVPSPPEELALPSHCPTRDPERIKAPSDVLVKKTWTKGVNEDGASTVFTVEDTVSTLSASVVQKDLAPPFPRTAQNGQPRLERVHEENNDAFNTTDDAVIGVSEKPDPEESNEGALADDCLPENLGCDTWCGNEPDTSLISSPEQEFRTDNGVSSPTERDDESEPPGFLPYLMTYLKAISKDAFSLGRSIGQLEWLITEDDLGGMLSILKMEMQRTPDDLPRERID